MPIDKDVLLYEAILRIRMGTWKAKHLTRHPQCCPALGNE